MEAFQAALAAIESGTSQREAVKEFGIPAITLHRHVAVAPLWGQKRTVLNILKYQTGPGAQHPSVHCSEVPLASVGSPEAGVLPVSALASRQEPRRSYSDLPGSPLANTGPAGSSASKRPCGRS